MKLTNLIQKYRFFYKFLSKSMEKYKFCHRKETKHFFGCEIPLINQRPLFLGPYKLHVHLFHTVVPPFPRMIPFTMTCCPIPLPSFLPHSQGQGRNREIFRGGGGQSHFGTPRESFSGFLKVKSKKKKKRSSAFSVLFPFTSYILSFSSFL